MLLLSQRTQKIKKSLSNSSDVSVRNFVVAGKDVSLVFLKGIIDRRRKSIEMAIKIAENETNDKKEEKA